MVRIKVIKASQVVYYAVLLVVALAALTIILATAWGGNDSGDAATPMATPSAAPSALPTQPSASLSPAPALSNEPDMITLPDLEEEELSPQDLQASGADDLLALLPGDRLTSAEETLIHGVGSFRVEVIAPKVSSEPEDKLSVLIYHTHDFEAYAQDPDDPYEETEQWRTEDPSYNIKAVGACLAQELRSLGVNAVHDTTVHEPPRLGTAYERSVKTLEQRFSNGERYNLIIDLHRDAGNTPYVTTINGVECARIMALLGNGNGFNIKPEYEKNLAFAERLTQELRVFDEKLARDVHTKDRRYNQHMNTPAMIIEVGNNLNTLDQALASMPYLAQSLVNTLRAWPLS